MASPTGTPRSPPQAPWRARAAAGALQAAAVLVLGTAVPAATAAEPLQGRHQVQLHARDGSSVTIGSLQFTPQADGRSAFTLTMQHQVFQDFFLSMKEFKCLPSAAEVFCHVPYPYPQPGSVAPGDLAWLEHSLLFLFKTPSEFGARLWNGVYWKLGPAAGGGLEGRPQAIDLNRISAPPDRPGVPPYGAAQRDDIAPQARWFQRLSITPSPGS